MVFGSLLHFLCFEGVLFPAHLDAGVLRFIQVDATTNFNKVPPPEGRTGRQNLPHEGSRTTTTVNKRMKCDRPIQKAKGCVFTQQPAGRV